jgi:hypothetical protein
VRAAAADGGVLPPETWRALVEAIREEDPDAAAGLERQDEDEFSKHEITIQMEERDAVRLSLEIAGLPRDIVTSRMTAGAHFLEDADTFVMTEDQQVISDAENFPGWVRDIGSDLSLAHAFHDEAGEQRLLVMNVNRTKIERTTGVDLLYWRREPAAFVLVQYKRLRSEGSNDRFRPSSDPNFKVERERMVNLRTKLMAIQGSQTMAPQYRLSADPFFFKFCSAVQAARSPNELMKGMYIPLAYWDLLESSGAITGPNGGISFDRENAGRWLNNTTFAALVGDAWLGTYAGASAYLTDLVRDSMQSSRSTIVAVELLPRPRGRRR